MNSHTSAKKRKHSTNSNTNSNHNTNYAPDLSNFAKLHRDIFSLLDKEYDEKNIFILQETHKPPIEDIEEVLKAKLDEMQSLGFTNLTLYISAAGRKISPEYLTTFIEILPRLTQERHISITQIAVEGKIKNLYTLCEKLFTSALQRLIIAKLPSEAFTNIHFLTSQFLSKININNFKLFYRSEPLKCKDTCVNCSTHEPCSRNQEKQADFNRSMEWINILKTANVKCIPLSITSNENHLNTNPEVIHLQNQILTQRTEHQIALQKQADLLHEEKRYAINRYVSHYQIAINTMRMQFQDERTALQTQISEYQNEVLRLQNTIQQLLNINRLLRGVNPANDNASTLSSESTQSPRQTFPQRSLSPLQSNTLLRRDLEDYTMQPDDEIYDNDFSFS